MTDTNGQSWGPVSSTSSFPYTKDFTCPSDPSLYTNGVYTMATHENTATIIETGDYDIATVDVTCNLPALQVTKTAAGEWDRTVTWTLEKSVNPASHSGFAGDSFDSTWEVVLTKNDTGPMNYYISGEISIYNPASITQSFTVADTLGDGTPVTIVCPSNTVAAGTTVTCTYEASPVDDSATLNTATVTAAGNPAKTATATVGWTENLTGSDSGNLTDPRFAYDENVSATTSVTFDETFKCSRNPSRYTNGTYMEYFTNNAYFVNIDHDLHADAQVGITCHLPALQVTKTAAGTWNRDVYWTLEKSVDPTSHEGYANSNERSIIN